MAESNEVEQLMKARNAEVNKSATNGLRYKNGKLQQFWNISYTDPKTGRLLGWLQKWEDVPEE